MTKASKNTITNTEVAGQGRLALAAIDNNGQTRIQTTLEQKKRKLTSIGATIMAMVEQIKSTIDCDIEGTPFSTENGQPLPSSRDIFLRIFISQQIQNIHNQIVGYKTSAGNAITGIEHYVKIGNLQTRDNAAFQIRLGSGTLSDNDLQAMHRLMVNEEKLRFLVDLKEAWELAFMEVFCEEWKPYNAAAPQPAAKKIDADKLARFRAAAI